ncbi:MAG: hypothetical protein KDE14_16595 [Rhodobacteraceae bacterium]|nr:hypothetical protein [Paracoccaceae bacterium]
MSRLISDAYQKLNYDLHKNDPSFGSAGADGVEWAARMVRDTNAQSLLDYGCGKGGLKPALLVRCPGLDIREYDPAISGKTADPAPADVVFCGDVMEHIEPEYLDSVLAHIASLAKKVAFLGISCFPAMKTLPDGRNAHLIVQDHDWWQAKVERYLRVIKAVRGESHLLIWGSAAKQT